jgi:hypothetical protein
MGVTVIDVSKLSPTEYKTFPIAVTDSRLAKPTYQLRFYDNGTISSGTVIIKCFSANEGSIPGAYLKTEGEPILPPSISNAEWSQNGFIEADVLPPPISTGKTYSYIGSQSSPGGSGYAGSILWAGRIESAVASSSAMWFERKHNSVTGGGRSNVASGNTALYDGAKHRMKLEWSNYTLAGVRYMYQRIYHWNMSTNQWDTLATADVAALYGATAWVEIPQIILSDGNTQATLSNIEIGTPSLPAGAIPKLSQ